MDKQTLFSLEQCPKCYQTKQLIKDEDNIEIITFPHDLNEWTDDNISMAQEHQVFEDLQRTAPILWLDGEKIVGYLRIRKWLQDNKK